MFTACVPLAEKVSPPDVTTVSRREVFRGRRGPDTVSGPGQQDDNARFHQSDEVFVSPHTNWTRRTSLGYDDKHSRLVPPSRLWLIAYSKMSMIDKAGDD